MKTWMAIALIAGLQCSAHAADLPLQTRFLPPEPIADSWTGFYLGVNVGALWSHETRNTTSPLTEVMSQSGSGWLGGGQIGYDRQISPSWLVGIEGSFAGADLSTTKRSAVNAPSLYVTDVNWLATVTGRIGYVAGPFLVYARGGYAATDVKFTGLETAAGDVVRVGGTRNGWTLGGGIEYLATRNISIGVEYHHADFGTRHYDSQTQVFNLPLHADVAFKLDRVILRANYRFGG